MWKPAEVSRRGAREAQVARGQKLAASGFSCRKSEQTFYGRRLPRKDATYRGPHVGLPAWGGLPGSPRRSAGMGGIPGSPDGRACGHGSMIGAPEARPLFRDRPARRARRLLDG
jgi:hypothetical protein